MALLGRMLLERGILSEKQLNDALEAQERLTSQGLEKMLGDLLIAKGFATPGDIREALEAQQKQVVVCGACRVQFNVRSSDVGSNVNCPRCFRAVKVPDELGDFNLATPLKPTYIDPGPMPVAYAVVKNFEGDDEIYALKEGDDLVAGSADDCQIKLEGSGVELYHCRFTVTGDDVLLADLSPDEGLYVNGRKVDKCALKIGDFVLLGKSPIMITPGLPGGQSQDSEDGQGRDNLMDAEPVMLVGQTIGKYRFVRLLGSGGMAIVLLAEQVKLNRPVAVKVLKREMAPNRKAVDRFVREALAGARLNHANIVQVFDAGTMGGLAYIAMEFVEGEDVGMWIKRFGKLPVNLAVSIGIQVAIGLDFAHQKGVIHRDVKPSNVMFTKDGRVKILDLGIAKVLHDAAPEKARTGVGTLVYMPPEQTRDAANVDHRADVYSLGASLYKMLTGQPPFKRKTVEAMVRAVRKERLPDPRVHAPDLPEAIVDVLQVAMAKKPEHRFQTIKEMQAQLVSVWNTLS